MRFAHRRELGRGIISLDRFLYPSPFSGLTHPLYRESAL